MLRLMMVLLLVSLLSGCGKAENAISALEERAGGKTKTEEQESSGKKEQDKGGTVTIGDDCSGYRGFNHLRETEMLKSIDDTEDVLTVFVPKGGSLYGENDYVSCYSDGVNVVLYTTLYAGNEQQDSTPAEYLKQIMDEEYDSAFQTDKENVVRSTVHEIENGAWQRAEYVTYNSYMDDFEGYSAYTVYIEMDDFTLLADIEVELLGVTENTDAIMQELASFYGFDNEWNQQESEGWLELYTSNPEVWEIYTTTPCSGMFFTMPRSWQRDYFVDGTDCVLDWYAAVYAVGGDAETAEEYVEFASDYVGADYAETFQTILEEPSYGISLLNEAAVGEERNLSFSTQQTQTLGEVLLIESETVKNDSPAVSRIYIGYAGEYLYGIRLVQQKDMESDAQEWIDSFLELGTVFVD